MIIVFWFEAVIFESLNELGNEKCVMEIENEKFCKNCKGNLFPPIIYQLTTNPLIFKFSNHPIFKFSRFQIKTFDISFARARYSKAQPKLNLSALKSQQQKELKFLKWRSSNR